MNRLEFEELKLQMQQGGLPLRCKYSDEKIVWINAVRGLSKVSLFNI